MNVIVPTGAVGSPAFTLTPNEVSTVTFEDDAVEVEVYSDGTAAVWWTCDGGTPAVDDLSSYYLPSTGTDTREPRTAGGTVVRCVSTGATLVRIARAD